MKTTDILRQYWGYDSFRGVQSKIIESIRSGHDTLGLMPTGGGKSLTFQVPAMMMEGVCVVITPLIALMKDQVQNLRRRGILAAAIYSGLPHDQILTTLENCIFGKTKLLYVSPERLGSELFQTKLRHMRVSFITVDEAHCISQWGYDFRPSYLKIADIRTLLPHAPVLALTATATPAVVQDIQDKLKAPAQEKPDFNVFRMSFERENLAYVVRRTDDKPGELLHILSSVKGSAIVYVRSRKRARETAEWLVQSGQSATFYHAGLDHATKDRRQQQWQKDEVRVMVATNAFGMGIDKPDVRMVVHTDCPDSVEAYFQEAGRAGRDGQKAYAVLLYNSHDHAKLEKRIADNFPEKQYIKQVYEHLAYYYQVATGAGYNKIFEFNLEEFCRRFRFFPIQADAALQLLDRSGYIEYTEEQENAARVRFLLDRDQLYRLEHNEPDEEKVIVALLRNYGGLFSDYTFIEEGLLALQTGLTQPQVYDILKRLSMKRIIHFIPRKKTPYIRYVQRREDSEHIIIPPHVYEQRREQFARRIHAILLYATTDNQCRSRQLLRYFGEENDHDCGQCDVCLSDHSDRAAEDRLQPAVDDILALLADGRRHHIGQLQTIRQPRELLQDALRYMMAEEMIQQEDGFLFII